MNITERNALPLDKRVELAVLDSRDTVQSDIDRLVKDLEYTTARIRALENYLVDATAVKFHRTAAYISQELGQLLRQPLGQNAQEFLLRDLANLAENEGAESVLATQARQKS